MGNPIQTKVEGDTLIIRIDVSKAAIQGARPSKSGDTRLVASDGSIRIDSPHARQPLRLALNLMAKPE